MMTALEEELITENERLTQQVKQLLLELKQERDYSNDLAMRLNDWKATDEKEINELLQNIKNEYENVIDDLTKKIQSNGQNIELLEKEMTRYENYIKTQEEQLNNYSSELNQLLATLSSMQND
jgi:hypothetical protein